MMERFFTQAAKVQQARIAADFLNCSYNAPGETVEHLAPHRSFNAS